MVCDDSDHGKSTEVVGKVIQCLVANHVCGGVSVCYREKGVSTFLIYGSEQDVVVCLLFGLHRKTSDSRR